MDSVLSWITVTAAVFYFLGMLLRQAVMETDERHAVSERLWREMESERI